MPPFLEALSGKVTDRWLSLVLPGLPLVAVIAVAAALGQRHSWSATRLAAAGDRWSAELATRSSGATVLVVAAVLLAAAAAGVVARTAGGLVRTIWISPWPRAGRRLTAFRQRRWRLRQAAYERLVLARHRGDDVDLDRLRTIGLRRNRIALAEPSRPTWMGDRLAAIETRVRAEYGLDLYAAWPRLWLLLAEDSRLPLRQAATALDTAALLVGWGSLYVAVGVAWWPSALVGAGTVLAGWWRGRRAAAAYADLTEATVDLHLADLAARFGLTADDAPELSSRLRKGA